MATKEYNKTDNIEIESLEDCPIRKAIANGKERLSKMGKPYEEPVQEKKATTKAKKKYNVILKVACVLGAVLLCWLAYSALFAPSIVDVILAIIGNFDLFHQFRGGNPLSPSDYVMFF